MRILTVLLASILLVGCGSQVSQFAKTDFRTQVEEDVLAAGAETTSRGSRGSFANQLWTISFTATEEQAHAIFESHRARVQDALTSQGFGTTGSGSGRSTYMTDFSFTYPSPSGSAVVYSLLSQHPDKRWSIKQLVHEPSGR